MSKELAQYIVEVANSAPTTVDVAGRKYIAYRGRMEEVKDGRIESLQTNTLQSILDYIRMPTGPAPDEWVIHVRSHDTVYLTSHPHGIDMNRDTYVTATIKAPGFPCDNFIDAEQFMITSMARLYDTPDKQALLDFSGDIQDIEEQRVKDTGTSQQITARSGIASVAEKPVPNPVNLAPFRTFPDVPQPVSPFILRVRNGAKGPEVAIFEADGGAWKHDAIQIIADYLRTQLADYTTRPVHIIA